MTFGKSYQELYNVRVTRASGRAWGFEMVYMENRPGKLAWDWQVDQLVYIEEEEVFVVPQGCMQFEKGDLFRYPK
ncbi:hypothetical protein Tsubulata_048897 [Turnera subulata]|uniref:(S)-ureidoglycine aminohydrolase cupin domain-containing protein n=1 Tax=Turnera subulata TaxID=218843 RepID=A0A9Q0JL56_9ROSI|nr:hypothetical protein Tsubulata_048897 [Turnera subulata]